MLFCYFKMEHHGGVGADSMISYGKSEHTFKILYNSKYSHAGNFREFREYCEIHEIFLATNITILQ